jgi:hypothetical protein
MIVIDEISILALWVANHISLTLRSISNQSEADFGRKKIIFIDDLLQLHQLIQGFSTTVFHQLITQFSCRKSIRKLYLHTPLKTSHPEWTGFLIFLGVGRIDNFPMWNNLTMHFDAISQYIGSPSSRAMF